MNTLRSASILLPFLLIASGCSDEATIGSGLEKNPSTESTNHPSADAAPKAKPEAKHVAEFTHRFPEGKENGNGASGGVRHFPLDGQPFYGFDDENFSSETEYEGKRKEVNFRMKLLDQRNGRDVYEIIRTVIVRETDGIVTRETKGAAETLIVEYAGEELTVFDDEHGVSKFVPQPVKPIAK